MTASPPIGLHLVDHVVCHALANGLMAAMRGIEHGPDGEEEVNDTETILAILHE